MRQKNFASSGGNEAFGYIQFTNYYGITPDMSLQWYALPYLFSGDKTVTHPRADRFSDSYPYDNPDFYFLQFRSNLVYRWEYKPGSVLYLVWSQGRTVQGNEAVPQNDYLVKVSYAWIF